MECHEQLFIDAILSSPSFDIRAVPVTVDVHQHDHNVQTDSTQPFSPQTPGTPHYYDALGSHPIPVASNQSKGLEFEQAQPRTSLLIQLPTDTALSKASRSTSSRVPLEDSNYEAVESVSTRSSTSAPSLSDSVSSLTPPSLVSTPITPPTPTSPILPTFPDLDLPVSIYRDIPFSPTIPAFTDCPFQYYREDIPRSKSYIPIVLSIDSILASSNPAKTMISTKNIESILEQSVREDLAGAHLQMRSNVFDSDLVETPHHTRDVCWDDAQDDEIVTLEASEEDLSSTVPIQIRRQKAWSTGGQQIDIAKEIRRWSEGMSLEAQMQELESTYNKLKHRHRQSLAESRRMSQEIGLSVC